MKRYSGEGQLIGYLPPLRTHILPTFLTFQSQCVTYLPSRFQNSDSSSRHPILTLAKVQWQKRGQWQRSCSPESFPAHWSA